MQLQLGSGCQRRAEDLCARAPHPEIFLAMSGWFSLQSASPAIRLPLEMEPTFPC